MLASKNRALISSKAEFKKILSKQIFFVKFKLKKLTLCDGVVGLHGP